MSENANPTIEHRPDFQTLNQYEEWVSENWIFEFGSEEAQRHAAFKLDEEVDELCRALETGTSEDIKLELGDVLWTAAAVAINEGFRLQARDVRLDDIDKVARQDVDWDVPSVRALYGLSQQEIKGRLQASDTEVTQLVLIGLAARLKKASRVKRHLAPDADPYDADDPNWNSAYAVLYHNRAIICADQIVLLISLIAQQRLGKSLKEVVKANFDKLSERINKGQPPTHQ